MNGVEHDVERRIEHGVALFRAGEYRDAHELWEELWRGAEPEARLPLQGLAQLAAAHLHLSQGNRAGYETLRRRAEEKLRGSSFEPLLGG